MTIEDKLKELILRRYHSIREFTIEIDMPYTTMDSIFRRGIGNSSVVNVIKICKALGISADALADGKIVPATSHRLLSKSVEDPIDIGDIFSEAKIRLSHPENLTLNGHPIDDDAIRTIRQGIEISLELAKRHNKNYNKNHNKN